MICAAAGPVDHDLFVEEVARAFAGIGGGTCDDPPEAPRNALTETWVERPTEQVHFCLGAAAPDEKDPDRWAMRLVTLILGGSMSSRLFQEIREKRGLCYHIAAESLSFRDAGQFVIYTDTSPDRVEEVRGLVAEELARLVDEGVSEAELERARNQVRAATLLSQDNAGVRVSRMTRALMFYDRLVSLSELVAQVERVTPEACRDVARRYFGSGEYAFAAIGPRRAKRRRRAR
jgi:predicted Zn-dependent peptidase